MSASTAPSTGPATVQPAIHLQHSDFSAEFNRSSGEFEYRGTLKLHSNMSGTPSSYQAILRGADGGLSIIAAKRNKLPYDRTNDDETENWNKNTDTMFDKVCGRLMIVRDHTSVVTEHPRLTHSTGGPSTDGGRWSEVTEIKVKWPPADKTEANDIRKSVPVTEEYAQHGETQKFIDYKIALLRDRSRANATVRAINAVTLAAQVFPDIDEEARNNAE
jgi:hypothetical protein